MKECTTICLACDYFSFKDCDNFFTNYYCEAKQKHLIDEELYGIGSVENCDYYDEENLTHK